MDILIAGGTGFIGHALVKHLLVRDSKYNITILSRKKTALLFKDKQKNKKINYLSWYELQYNSDNIANIVSKFDCIINLCGLNIGKSRWSTKFKEQLIDSRVEPTRILAKACVDAAKLYGKTISLYNASAIGVYGLSDSSKVYTEDSFIRDSSDFLSKIGKVWEIAAGEAIANDVRVVFMRFGVVLDWRGGALKKMVLPFKLGFGGKIGNGKQPFTWIALDDLVRVIEILINNNKVKGPVNLVAPEITTQATFAKKLAKFLRRPCFMPMPEFIVKLLFGQMGQELLLSGQQVKSYKLNVYYKDWLHPSLDDFFEQ